MPKTTLTLHEAADELGVHYMTVYRYVRLGVVEATKSGGVWQVERSALDRFREQTEPAPASAPAGRRGHRAPWAARLESRLVAGDAAGAWGVIEGALVAGADLDEIYLGVLTPAMVDIGDRWARGELDVSEEHRASGIAMRIIGRLGPRFARRGRTRGSILLAAPAGEFHALPLAMLGDLLRLRGWDVSDIGVDVPISSVAHAVREQPDLVAVGLSAMSTSNLGPLEDACAAAREAAPDVMIVVGGRAIVDDAQARALGADAMASGGAEMDALLRARLRGG
jgi:MerR family transcriptional regulator, light-induced transcriptional regulator